MKNNEKESSLSELLKKVVTVGVGAAFMTEDAVKTILGDLPLPKDVITGLMSNAKNIKEDLVKNLREEVHGRLASINVSDLIADVLDKYDLEVNAKVSFKRKNNKEAKKSSVSVKR